jgi:hypothetical protein
MSTIKEFFAAIPHAEGDNCVLQEAFLHHLFPDSFSFVDVQEMRAMYDHASFKLLAADAWMLLQHDAGAQVRFQAGWDTLLERSEPPHELPYHRPALLGLALATHATSKQARNRVWWHDMLVRVRRHHPDMADLLEVVLGWVAPVPPAQALDVFAIAGALFSPQPSWDAKAMAHFLNGQRKCSFPYAADFFENMLRAYVEDFAIGICMRYATELLPGMQQKLLTALERLAKRQARGQVAAAALIVLVWMVLACYLLFAHGPAATQMQADWDALGWAFLWVSGPVGATLSLIGIVFFWIKDRTLDFDFAKMRDRYAAYLLGRWTKLLDLPKA